MKHTISTIAIILALVFPSASAFGLSGELVVEGTSESQGLLRDLAWRFMRVYGNVALEIPEGLGSTGGIKALRARRVEVARTARPLTQEERQAGLAEVVFARAPVVFVVHPAISNMDSITSEQVAAIYSGKVTRWDEIGGGPFKIYPVAREQGSSVRELIEEKIPGLRGIELAPMAKTAYSSVEVSKILKAHKNTIGYMSATAAHGSGLKVLKLDGASPSVKNVENGEYPLVVPLSLVHKGKPGPVARAFEDFLFRAEASDVIVKYGSAPVNKRQ